MSNTEVQNYKAELAKKTFWLFTGRAMPVIILFLITILYSRHLSYDNYGKFQSIWMYTNIINVFISFGITSVLLSSNLSFLFAFIKRHAIKIIFFYFFQWIIVLAVFFWYGKNFSSSTKFLLIVFIIIQNVITILETLQIKNHKEKFVFSINFIYAMLFFAWHYYILLNGFHLDNLIKGIIIISLIKAFLLFFFKKNYVAVSAESGGDDSFMKHWIYLGLNDMFGVLAKWIDKLFLLYLLTAADFAVFFNGSFEIPLFALLVSVVGSVLLIDISSKVSEKQNVIQIFNEGFRILSLIVFPLFLFLFFFRVELFAIFFKHKYDASLPIFLISIFILPVRINNYSSILQCYSSGKKILAGSALDIFIIIILLLIFYPAMGTKGVAMSIVIGTYSQAFYYLWQSAKVLGTQVLTLLPVKILALRLISFTFAFAIFYFSIIKFSNEIKLLMGAIFTATVILISIYFYFAKKQLLSYVFTKKD
ncbi:MAG: oligosaccharide flippase family protein [Bacteroidota bacterium]|nr:oligosaccharide flippase family protein [Bacteroidota bacterium]